MEDIIMQKKIDISLIVSIYDKYDYLYVVLNSIEKQSFKNFEVIIAEDCEKEQMIKKIEEWSKEFTFNIKHVSQEDIGFRKNMILNKAIKLTQAQNIVIIDGDCILHRKFLENYMNYFRKGYNVVFGRRCEMSENLSKKILELKGNYKIKMWDLIKPYSKAWTECIYFPFIISLKKRKLRLLGSNMGFTKEIIYKINGFNEDYTGACIGEDTDLEWRFLRAGAKYKAVKNQVIQYHIFHGRADRQNTINGLEILKNTKENDEWFCKNGLVK